ncbi:MAG: polyprenyl synthetase family protein [Thermodesulfobacteriota bacterium]
MTENEFKYILSREASVIHTFLQDCMQKRGIPEKLSSAMQYSLLAGGKRLRPVLCLNWAKMLGAEQKQVLSFAAGLECIHTYSLIHDDLPAMDDDDLRRGKPTNHKKYGEALAILAGDGLLTFAFELMLECAVRGEPLNRALLEIARAAGAGGMVGGQVLDMEYTGQGSSDLDKLQNMHLLKTGALLVSSCVTGAVLAGGGEDDVRRAGEFGRHVGLAFQIADDILDVTGDQEIMGKPVGSDEKQGKFTYPALIGIEKSKKIAQKSVSAAGVVLEAYTGEEKEFLLSLTDYIVNRVS